MLDIRFIRENPALVQENAKNKGYDVNIEALLQHDETRRGLQSRADELRERRNAISSQLQGGRPSDELISQAKVLKDELAMVEVDLRKADESFTTLIKQVPNMAASDVPVGTSEDENIVSKVVGQPTSFDFTPRSHADIAAERHWIDKERAAKVTGSRFGYIKGDLVKLQFAIIQFVLDTLTDEEVLGRIASQAGLSVPTTPFVPVLPPLMIRTAMYDAMDRLEPRDDRYKLENDDLWLQGSAEHVLGSMHADEIIDQAQLPLRYVGYATSFRREAGAYGKDMEGIFRMHQFDKLEMESLSTSQAGPDEHLFFVAIQEYLLSTLGLPYRVIQKCTADIGKPNARGVDMDTWLPGQANYRETHTADYMTDYQARRLKTRVRRENGELDLVHTNDATAFALGRIMIAIIENGQMADNKVAVPTALQPYLAGRRFL
ncbi:MAG: serine--tRNA ligase [Candidatus Saccharibacteria bacterium]